MNLHVVPDHHDPAERFYGGEGPPERKFHITMYHPNFTVLVTVYDRWADHAFDMACEVMGEHTESDVEFWQNLKAEIDDEYGGITSV